MTELFGRDLPRPDGRRLFLYLLGPGVGESQVVVFPDGRTLVVDSCQSGEVNLPHALLLHLGVTSIDLLVLTHPDLDHVRGFAKLVRERSPAEIWRYPLGSYVRDFAAEILRQRPGERRLVDLSEALDAIDEHQEEHGESTDAYVDRAWSGKDYEVRCVAPTPCDQRRMQKLMNHCTAYIAGERRKASRRFERFLAGETSLGDAPNVLSVALGIRWGGVQVLLGGDVEKGNARPFSGWKGVMRLLDKPGRARGTLLESLAAVKVAHHGSAGAFHGPTWERHARGDGSTVALLTPFQTKLPAGSVLRDLGEHCGRLGISAASDVFESRVRSGGWTVTAVGGLGASAAPCLVAIFGQDGTVELHRGGAGLFCQSAGRGAR